MPQMRVAQEILTDRQTDKKWTNKQTEVHQFRKQLSYDGDLSQFLFCLLWWNICASDEEPLDPTFTHRYLYSALTRASSTMEKKPL